MKPIFITATDTDAGKTFIACALIHALTQRSYKVSVFKPISAGCIENDYKLINEDAQHLSNYSNCTQTLNDINPIRFKKPIAPHIAAKQTNRVLSVTEIMRFYKETQNTKADFIITEGAGGWRLPLNSTPTKTIYLSDFVKNIQFDVILVINMKLGCLNHAILTYEAIKADGVNCIGWIANCANKNCMNYITENIQELEKILSIPLIGSVEHYQDDLMTFDEKIHHASSQLDISVLL